MLEDRELLLEYVDRWSEQAFTEFVKRHLDLVYSVALREVGFDCARAEDLSQEVFTELSRKASMLKRHPALVAWLYTCVRQMAANHRRAEERRRRREQELQAMNEILGPEPSEIQWQRIQPALDSAMHELSDFERSAVILRFFEERNLKDVGQVL